MIDKENLKQLTKNYKEYILQDEIAKIENDLYLTAKQGSYYYNYYFPDSFILKQIKTHFEKLNFSCKIFKENYNDHLSISWK